MSKIEELIQQLCPNGVECKKIGDICEISRGIVISKNYIQDNIGEYPVYSSQTEDNGCLGKIKTFAFEGEYLTWTTDGANAGTLFYRTGRFNITNVCGLLKVKDNAIYIKYLYYSLGIEAPKYVNNGMGNAKLMSNVMSNIRIPVPPFPVQEEIVRILDNFTNLTAELQAELQARKSQYEYYRDELLNYNCDKSGSSSLQSEESLSSHNDGNNASNQIHKLNSQTDKSVLQPNVKWMKLGEIATSIYRGSGIKREEITSNGIPCVRYGEIYTTYNIWFDKCISHTKAEYIQNKKYFEYGDILFVITGENVEEIAKAIAYVGHETCLAGGDIVVMKHNQNPKYLSYALSTVNAQKQKSKGKVKSKVVHSSVPALQEIIIPIPPLAEQDRIVKILDRFDALVNDLSVGLPAEIAARQKQYEYYRDMLLSFNELPNE